MPSKAENLSKLAASLSAGGYVAVNTLTITDSSYTAVSDLAVRPAGGYIKIIGSNFAAGCVVYVNGSPATSTTFVNATEVRAQLPALAVGIYSLMLFNAATSAAIWSSGIMYSAAPVWTSTSYVNQGNVVSTQLLATGDSTLTYTLASGTLPTGVTLSSTGLLSGTASAITSTTTVSFTVAVTDAQNQANPQVISFTLSFETQGKLWAMGYGNDGNLGDSTLNNRSSPVQVGSLTTWNTIGIMGKNSTLAIKVDGTLWSWGINSYGQLGLGDTTRRSSPVQVGTLTNWKTLSSGLSHNLATKTDGTLWAWGKNGYGPLGDNTAVDKSSPVQVGTLTDWLVVAAGRYHSLAIKTNGTLWGWGRGYLYANGSEQGTTRSSPVQIGTLTNWESIQGGQYWSSAIKTDGTLWTWGDNASGQLGLGDTTTRSSPVQVGTLTTWSSHSGKSKHLLAIKTNNTLWAWGNNGYGNLGLGNSTYQSSPVQVGLLTNWSTVATGGITGAYTSGAIKTDGTFWNWGSNQSGQLGDGTLTARNSPIQVGSLSNWLAVSAGGYVMMALSL